MCIMNALTISYIAFLLYMHYVTYFIFKKAYFSKINLSF